MKRLAILLLWLAAAAGAQPLPAASLQQRIGATVPLDTPVRDDLGRPARLADYFEPGRPVLLVPGYYRCPQLCGLVMQDLLQALQISGAPPSQWRIVGLSIDPEDRPADAQRRRVLDLDYARFLRGAKSDTVAPRLDLLVADPAAVRRVTGAIGFVFAPQAGGDGAPQYAHPATVVLLTPAGTVSRYFNGVGIDAGDLRGALASAANGGLGTWSGRFAALCAHLDPARSAHGEAVMNAVRAAALLAVLALAGFVWRQRRKDAS